jgi:hypothetical protein
MYGLSLRAIPVYKLLYTIILSIFFLSCSSEKPQEIVQKPSEPAGTSFSETSQAHYPASTDSMSNIIEIKNAPPVITGVKILPEIFKPGDTLSVEVSGNDADGDEVTIVYEWTKNGEPAGNGKRLEAPVKRGDKISVRIIPFDGEINGQAVILNREIKNMPPMIIEDNKFHFDGKFFSYQIKAVDPDSDALIYILKQAPEGMVIDKTGLITWKVSEKDKGRHSVAVQVTDGQGGEASYTFNVTNDSPQ